MTIKSQNIYTLKRVLQSLLNEKLPGMSVQKEMIPFFPDNVPEYFNYNQSLRQAAVLIALFEEKKRIKTILIERVIDSGPHSGQIAFPGGKKEDFDKTLLDTALREAHEEVGIKLSHNDYIGSLTSIQIPISKFCVQPVVCTANFIPKLIKNIEEVSNIFVVDLFDLFESENVRSVYVRNMKIDAPSFAFKDQIVWGATAMVLKEFKEVILPHLNF